MASHQSQWMRQSVRPLLTCLALINTSSAVQIFQGAGAVPSAVPAACATTLIANVSCQQFVPAAYISAQRSMDNATLTYLCTSTCTTSLLQFQAQVEEACGTESYAFSTTVNQTVQQIVDPLIWAYNVSCLAYGGSFCLPEITNASEPHFDVLGMCFDVWCSYAGFCIWTS